MTAPEISVVIPHYDDLSGLARCLDALEAQTIGRSRFEILVGDNGSPCGLDAVEAVTANRACVVEVRERGAGPARNGAAAVARGDILAFIDSDCIADSHWLEAGVAALAPRAFAGGQVIVPVEANAPLSGAEAYEVIFAFRMGDYIRRKGFTGTGNLFVRRADFGAVGPFRTGVSEDVDWCRRATANGLTLVYAPDAIAAHPARPDWAGLFARTRRIQSELFLLAAQRRFGRLRWFVRSLAMPVSIVAHAPRILRARSIRGARVKALRTLVRLRLWRAGKGLRQALTGRA
ncbi:MAG: glycosyltransferase [Sphingomonadaceae bacterium]|nr:glycosyltransferase [Sphingomonadaceae bacterium]